MARFWVVKDEQTELNEGIGFGDQDVFISNDRNLMRATLMNFTS